MSLDRVVLGPHSNTDLGVGIFVAMPGANVMHPEYAQAGNLMFNSSEPHSALSIIQSGTFKITCSRKAISGRGETIGTRPNDIGSELFLDGTTGDIDAHTFAHDTGRPAGLTTLANSLVVTSSIGYKDKSFGKKIKGKQSNYLDTGSHSIQIASPLPNGEIPEVSLHFAVGNSSGHFHPWYADVTATGSKGNWDEWTYNDSTKIVHMDSNWMRLKWGGLGAEEYRGIQDEYTYDSLLSFFGGDAQKIVDKFGFSNPTDAQNKLKNSKLLSLAINNSQGIVGLIPYVNATSFTVDAYMSPTHAGLRQPVDRTFEKNRGRQKGVGFNAIDDYAHINFPIEHHPHTSGLTDTQIEVDLNARQFKHLPGIPLPYHIYRDSLENYSSGKGGDFDNEDQGKRDMFGWGGHPTDFFVNPFSNGTLTFYTHMQPPYVTNKGTNTVSGKTYTGHYIPIGYENEPTGGVNQVWGPTFFGSPPNSALNETQWNLGTADTPDRAVFNGAGVKWPPGHPHADYLDHRDWTGSMGLAGAGSKEAMAVDDVWDTFYISYIVYSTGAAPIISPQSFASGSTSASPSATNKVSEINIWDAYWGSGKQGAEAIPSIINNFIFPDDLVGTVGDPSSDPFAGGRDSSGKIYGNMHFNLVFDEGKTYGSAKFDSLTGIPLPAITLDFSESKWNFIENNKISLSIKNSSRIVGGGGSGGVGIRRRSAVTKSGDVSDGGYGGGGGGAGGGTGRNPNEQTAIGSIGYNGTGWGGDGWARGLLSGTGEFVYGDEGSIGSKFEAGGVGGAKAIQISTENIDTQTFTTQFYAYAKGGDGGDAFHVNHPSTIQPLIEIENSGTGIIISGGGGGAGGYEVDGASGGTYGGHGQSTVGTSTFVGGNPGYIISSPANTYTRPVKIININNGIIQGRNPGISSYDTSNTSGGIAGGWILTGNNAANSSLPGVKSYREAPPKQDSFYTEEEWNSLSGAEKGYLS